jgi:ATP-binding cassette subfamily E protein 1
VLGLVGKNGIGKSTALKILSGKLVPNMGDYTSRHGYEDVAKIFKGSELQKYFSRLASGELRCVSKPQYVDNIPKAVKGVVGELLRKRGCAKSLIADLDLSSLLEREVAQLSGGELQRFAIAVTACTSGSRAYMFDEPSSFLDVRQRLNAARVIRGCLQSGESDAQNSEDKYVIVVEHDLSVLDYISDTLCFLYGKPSSYGVVTLPMGVREGINAFLSGYLPAENMRFREEAMNFRVSSAENETVSCILSTEN